jgi:hypothetical protein
MSAGAAAKVDCHASTTAASTSIKLTASPPRTRDVPLQEPAPMVPLPPASRFFLDSVSYLAERDDADEEIVCRGFASASHS